MTNKEYKEIVRVLNNLQNMNIKNSNLIIDNSIRALEQLKQDFQLKQIYKSIDKEYQERANKL